MVPSKVGTHCARLLTLLIITLVILGSPVSAGAIPSNSPDVASTQLDDGDHWLTGLEDLKFNDGILSRTAPTGQDSSSNSSEAAPIVKSGATITEIEQDNVGDIVTIHIDFSAQNTQQESLRTWMHIGEPGDRILDLVNVTDVSDDGQATIQVDSFVMGRGDPTTGANLDAAYTALGTDTVNVTRPRHYSDVPGATSIAGPSGSEQVWGHETGQAETADFQTPPRNGIASPIRPTSLALTTMSRPLINLSQDETELVYPHFSDGQALTLQDRITSEAIGIYVAPRGTSSEGLDTPAEIRKNATRINSSGHIDSNSVANGDWAILQITASGIKGYVNSIDDLLMETNGTVPDANLSFNGANGIHLFVAQQQIPVNEEPYYWNISQHGTLISDEGNDTYYVRVPTDSLTGVGTRTSESPPNTDYEAKLIIAGGQFADYWEEGDYPSDPNFQATGDNATPDTFDMDYNPYLLSQEQEISVAGLRTVQRIASFDQYNVNEGELIVTTAENVTLSGTTNLAPGSEFRVSLRNTSRNLATDVYVTVTTGNGERTWATGDIDLSNQDAGTEFLTWALERGTSITDPTQGTTYTAKGAAVPSRFTSVPTASVTFDDQTARDSGTLVTVQSLEMNRPGFVTIRNGSETGDSVGVSRYLENGSHTDIDIRLSSAVSGTQTLVAVPHIDTNDNQVFDYPNGDKPFGAFDSANVSGASLENFSLVVSPQSIEENQSTKVVITATNEDTGSSVEDAFVLLDGQGVSTSDMTNATGIATFTINASSTGTINVTVEKSGFNRETANISVVSQLLTLDWTASTPGRSQHSTPAVGTDRVFVGGLDSTVYALFRANGSVAWQHDRAGSLSDSSPVVNSGTVFIGSGSGTLYALDATSGKVDWTHSIDSAIVSTPRVSDGILYVGSNDGRVLALDAASGNQQWSRDIGGPVHSTPAIDSGRVFVTSNTGEVTALDTSDGSLLWSRATNAELGHSSPRFGENRVYVAGEDVMALDPADGSVLWSQGYGETVGSTPTFESGTLYVGSADGSVYALNATTGSVSWTAGAGGPVAGDPISIGDRLVVSSTAGRVYLYDKCTGSILDSVSLGAPSRSSPGLGTDVIYVGNRDGTITALSNISAS